MASFVLCFPISEDTALSFELRVEIKEESVKSRNSLRDPWTDFQNSKCEVST